ncbi:N-acetyltransferase [Raphanus sativus]|nr:N-acetyltransferase [Raphanus sativus]
MEIVRCDILSCSKYCSLVLKCGVSDEILVAITYQIVPADTQYAEIPLAAGFGKLVYEELMKRLRSVGIRTIYCWADKESEDFWLKQGFISLVEIDQKGKAKRLHIKSNIRKALCFPGGLSTIRSPVDSTTTGKEQEKVISDQATTADSDSTPGFKRCWEASMCSLQSKRIRANCNNDSEIAKEDL